MSKLMTVLGILGFCVFLGSIYVVGVGHGEQNVQTEWDKERLSTALHIRKVEREYALLTHEHTKKTEELRYEIIQTKAEYEDRLVAANNEHVGRLRNSEQRANLYKRQSEAGAIECRVLADHAAELDSALERGRDLVQRLGITLRQREHEIGILSSQIHADRHTLDKVASVNGN